MRFRIVPVIVLAGALLPPASGGDRPAGSSSAAATADDYMVVDCLLPGRVRRLGGGRAFQTPRRPVRTTAIDCRIRGGEYTEFDRASYGSALKVWLGEAKAGDSEAQYYVGQIYEKGLGADPDYQAAAHWYRQAAEQDYSAAELALGYLYENGLGVEQSSEEALLWYRRASDLPDDVVVMSETEQQELFDELAARDDRIQALEAELVDLQGRLQRSESVGAAAAESQQELRTRLAAIREEMESERQVRVAVEAELAKVLGGTAGPAPRTAAPPPAATAERASASDLPEALARLDYGPYVALVIANERYRELPAVETAREDAEAVAGFLEKKYGFEVRRVFDATRYQILSELNRLREDLTERHNLLVYYAGHSERDTTTQRSWWQPVDAAPGNRANWLAAEIVADHLDLIPAKRVLLVADAAYAGALTRSGVTRLSQGMSEQRRVEVIREMLDRRVRMVLESGGERPRPTAETPNSAFASRLLEQLSAGEPVVLATELYRRLQSSAVGAPGEPVPRLALLRWARGEGGGDFFFVARTAS